MEEGREAPAHHRCCVRLRIENSFCAVLLLSHCLRSHPLLFNLWNIPGSILSFPDLSPGLGLEGSEGLLLETGGGQIELMAQLVEATLHQEQGETCVPLSCGKPEHAAPHTCAGSSEV